MAKPSNIIINQLLLTIFLTIVPLALGLHPSESSKWDLSSSPSSRLKKDHNSHNINSRRHLSTSVTSPASSVSSAPSSSSVESSVLSSSVSSSAYIPTISLISSQLSLSSSVSSISSFTRPQHQLPSPPSSRNLLSSSFSASSSSSSSSSSHHQEGLTSLNQLRMLEEKAIPKNITAQVGLPVYLHCIVEPIGDKMVSWIRLRDFHLLTVGLFTYTSDSRFVIRHGTLQPNDWALQIKHVTPKDEGLYECQVNTDPPRSQYFHLKVLVPYTQIAGSGNDMVVSAGSTINLTCIISQSPHPPSYVFWYHNDRMINYDLNNEGQGQVTLTKDPVKSDTLVSRLTIRNARYNNSGNYTCAPFNIEPSSIYLHVLQGAKQLSQNWPQNDEGSSTEYTSSNHGESCYRLTTLFATTTASSTLIKFFIILTAIINNQLMYSCIT